MLLDDDLELLDKAALRGPKALAEELDRMTGVAEARALGDAAALRMDSVLVTSFGDKFWSQAAEDLATFAKVIGNPHHQVSERVDCCIRLLRMRTALLEGPDAPPALALAQRTLSGLLIQHPVLLHPRVMFRSTPFSRTEFAPLAHLIALTPRVEFPRLAHGVDAEKLTAFANHWCVRAGMQHKASKPQELQKTPVHQGKTMLQCVLHLYWPRVRFLASVFELDSLRGSGKSTASLLAPRGDKLDHFHKVVALSVLAHCGIQPASDSNVSVPGFIEGLKRSGLCNEEWFLPALECYLGRWLPADQVQVACPFDGVEGIRNLAHALVELNPKHLPRTAASEVMGRPVSMADAVRWLVPALLDASAERAAAAGASFKHFPKHADSETAARLLQTLAEIVADSVPIGEFKEWFQAAVHDAPINREPVWEVAMTATTMTRAIAGRSATATQDQPAARQRPRAQV